MLKSSPFSHHRPPVRSASFPSTPIAWPFSLCLGAALLLTTHSARAQSSPAPADAGAAHPATAPAASPPTTAPPVAAASFNVLILALDTADINAARVDNIRSLAPKTDGDAKPQPAAPALEAPAPTPDEEPKPGAPVAAPAIAERPPRVLPRWRALAQQTSLPPAADASSPIPDSLQEPVQRPPGRAQLAGAALRRVLLALGFQDVLMTPLDSASVVRAINNGHLELATADALRFATGQMLEAVPNGAEANADPARAATRQKAITAASRIGLALGYRAVVVLAVAPQTTAARPGAVYSLLIVDAPRETGEAHLLQEEGADQHALDQSAAGVAAARITATLGGWEPFTNADRAALVEKRLATARAALEKHDTATARDQLNLVVSLDPSNSAAYILLGDALQDSDPTAAARAYQRASEIDTKSGEVWAKIAIVHTLSDPPDWVRALQAANRALELRYDSANLRTTMAAAEFGRAELLRRGGRIEQAEDAELVARRHLDRARELAPDSPEVTASISRLMAKYLIEQKRYKEAVQSLDLLAIQYPNDLKTQTMYARALEGYGRRDEDTFLAWARVWKLSGESRVPLSAARYTVLADGFDQRLANIGKNVFQLTSGFAAGAVLREAAILQTKRAKDDFAAAVAALRLIQPPPGRVASEAHVARLYAADLMQLALEHYSIYLETGNDLNRTRAIEEHRQAIENLNVARGGGAGGGA
jgi:tetratricopeptide (TPR) repeat protein